IPDMHAVIERLESLETQNRWLRGAGALVLVSVGTLVLMAQAAPKNRTVEAGRFVVLDSQGRSAAVLSVEGGEPGLVMKSPHGMASLMVASDGAGLLLSEGKG